MIIFLMLVSLMNTGINANDLQDITVFTVLSRNKKS